jgi:hypothetical protein
MREDKTIIYWPETGYTRCIRYTNDKGELHRVGGPAVQYFSENGTLIEELYYVDGYIHRTDGPAQIVHRKNQHFYWVNNVCFSEEDFKRMTAKPVEKKPAIQIEFKVLVNGKEIALSEERLTKLVTALVD